MRRTNKDLTDDEISSISNSIKVIGGTTDFVTLHKFYKLSIDGLKFITHVGGVRMINLIDFENPKTIFSKSSINSKLNMSIMETRSLEYLMLFYT